MLVEIIGLAGAGKSSLIRTLEKENQVLTHADRLSIRSIENLQFYLTSGLSVLPFWLLAASHNCRFSREEMSRILYLTGMHRYFQRLATDKNALVLDQGPIFELATLYAFGPAKLREPRFDGWWEQHFQRWANSLDLIVWLSAPVEILRQRIQMREQKHAIKESSAEIAEDFLQRYHAAYEYVIYRLNALKAITILHIDSSKLSSDEIASKVVTLCTNGEER